MIVVVMAIPGREQLTAETLRKLDDYGGAHELPRDVVRVLHWTSPARPPFAVPRDWALWHESERRGHRRDLWHVLEHVVGPTDDVLLFEDDVEPCRNAVPFIARWPHDVFTTFHNMMRLGPGLLPIDRNRFFWGIQSVKIPARLVRRFVAAGDTDKRPQLVNEGGDTRLGRLLMEWGEPIYHHRSLVQHIGAKSVGNPGATLKGIRAPATDFDVALDALTLDVPGLGEPLKVKCDWPGKPTCTADTLPGTQRCDDHTIRRRPKQQLGRGRHGNSK